MNILIGGEAGQGLATVGEILAKSLVRSGYFIVVTQSYQSRIRGGHNTFAIRVSSEEILAPQESVDLLVALDNHTLSLHQKEVTPNGRIVADQGCSLEEENCLKVPYGHLAADKFSNITALGVVCALLGLDEASVGRTLEDFFGKKKPGLIEENLKVLSEAFRWTFTQPSFSGKLPPLSRTPARVMMQGNEAIALGAISAGLKFYSFYPMTPSTSISLTLARLAGKMGLIVEQAEDEIAAINMAIGASFAGAPSMVATSGGGFALMMEGVSLAAMTETPLVIVIAQRPGPATGLPTRTEQGDLNFVLHAGHGEFPRAIFAPGTIEECFALTLKAFFLAEKFQGPIFMLTDQFLSDSYRAVTPFDVETIVPPHTPNDALPAAGPYRRFALTESGVSPRLLPGLTEHLVVAGSDEHTEDGHLTEDLSVRKQMVEKRLKKSEGICQEVIPPDYKGDRNPDLLFISWGSTKGSVCEAVSTMRSSGQRVASLHFSQIWPLIPDQFMGLLQEAGQVVCVEGNATGQFAGLIRRETGFKVHQRMNRYDGFPITPEYIFRELK
ncbi:MAG: 2-oxoacid:acceptor oxidoreductase subunit alpha [Thermodesulfobacteriota bacterium]|nr:2-oxoacid:acceptor oxidoreductase subunit alpha [Thermodesulfobacteriota bacterium]